MADIKAYPWLVVLDPYPVDPPLTVHDWFFDDQPYGRVIMCTGYPFPFSENPYTGQIEVTTNMLTKGQDAPTDQGGHQFHIIVRSLLHPDRDPAPYVVWVAV